MTTLLLLIMLGAPVVSPAPFITIDDGPDYRRHVRTLQLLQRHHVRATWFVNGHFLQSKRNQRLLRQIVRAGHRVANHLYSHRDPCRMSSRQFLYELRRTERMVNFALGRRYQLRLYRPPFGHRCHAILAMQRGYHVQYWHRADIGSTAQQMIRTVLHRWRHRPPRRSILLFHHHNRKLQAVLRRFYPRAKRSRPRPPTVVKHPQR